MKTQHVTTARSLGAALLATLLWGPNLSGAQSQSPNADDAGGGGAGAASSPQLPVGRNPSLGSPSGSDLTGKKSDRKAAGKSPGCVPRSLVKGAKTGGCLPDGAEHSR